MYGYNGYLGPRPEDLVDISERAIDKIFVRAPYKVEYESVSWQRLGFLRVLGVEDPTTAYIKTRSIEGLSSITGFWWATEKIPVKLLNGRLVEGQRQVELVKKPRNEDPELIFTFMPPDTIIGIRRLKDIPESELYHLLRDGLDAVSFFGVPIDVERE